jgi:hypothetical protein
MQVFRTTTIWIPKTKENLMDIFYHQVALFLKTRKNEDTKKYTRLIIEYLQDHPEGVRASEFIYDMVPEKIPNTSSFYNIVSDLVSFNLIEKESQKTERGKPAVYYKIGSDFFSLKQVTDTLQEQLIIAFGLLKVKGVDPQTVYDIYNQRHPEALAHHNEILRIHEAELLKSDADVPKEDDKLSIKLSSLQPEKIKYKRKDGSIWEIFKRPDGSIGKRKVKAGALAKIDMRLLAPDKKSRERKIPVNKKV